MTIPWSDPISEFLPEPVRTRAIIQHVLGEHVARPSRVTFLTDQIMNALQERRP